MAPLIMEAPPKAIPNTATYGAADATASDAFGNTVVEFANTLAPPVTPDAVEYNALPPLLIVSVTTAATLFQSEL